MYDQGMDEAAPSEADESKPHDEDQEGEESESQTTLVPKSMFGGKEPQPGDVCKFEIEHIYEDEVEIRYVNDNEKPKSEMSMADEKMDQMGEANMEAEE